MRIGNLQLWIFVCCLSNVNLGVFPRWFYIGGNRNIYTGASASKVTEDGHLNDQSFSNDSQRSRLLKALQLVQRKMTNKLICSPNQSVILDVAFEHARWKSEALLAVEVANLLTSLWRVKTSDGFSMAENDTFLYNLVRSNILFSPSVFGSVVCFERDQYRNYERFCPYAFRDRSIEAIHVKDISVGHDYLTSSETIWWREPRLKALNRTVRSITDLYTVRLNASVADSPRNISVPVVSYDEDGYWTRPYYDCFGGNIWMVTFLAPFFNDSDEFLGVVSIDVELSSMDINQCDAPPSTLSDGRGKTGSSHRTESTDSADLLEFLGTHKCKPSTQCEPISNQGFKRGSYRCTCKRGYYFPDSSASIKSFNGSVIEEEYDKKMGRLSNSYDDKFECVACSEGCVECVDSSACVYVMQVIPRMILIALNALAALMAVLFGAAVFVFREHKVFEASSPIFLEVILFAAVLMYASLAAAFFGPSDLTCTIEVWLYQCGLFLLYGTLALKVWRVVSSFRARSPRRVDVTEGMMAGRLSILCTLVVIYLLIWTFVMPPRVVNSTSDLHFKQCSMDLMTYVGVCGNFILLVGAMLLCFRVRNAPSAYNENRFISWAVYNSMFVTCFVAVLRFLTTNNTNPDILFAMSFILVHMTATVTLLLLFIPKFVLLRKLRGQAINRRLTNCQSRNSFQSPNGVLVNDISMVERENEDLKDEVKRLAVKVAFLKSRLMKDKNKHLKSSNSSHCRTRYHSNNDDIDDTLEKMSSSPVTRFLSSRV